MIFFSCVFTVALARKVPPDFHYSINMINTTLWEIVKKKSNGSLPTICCSWAYLLLSSFDTLFSSHLFSHVLGLSFGSHVLWCVLGTEFLSLPAQPCVIAASRSGKLLLVSLYARCHVSYEISTILSYWEPRIRLALETEIKSINHYNLING